MMVNESASLLEFLTGLVGFAGLQPISSGYQNEIFEFEKNGTGCILRVTSEQHRSRTMIEEELKLLDYLYSMGEKISVPVPFTSGTFIEEYNSGEETFFITQFKKAPGRPVNVSDLTEWNKDFFQLWGSTLGALHRSSSMLNKNMVKRPEWVDFAATFGQGMKAFSEISSLSKNANVYGLIHNDFHHGNFFVDGKVITTFDFDDCVYGWFANDLAVAIYHAMWNGKSEHPEWTDFEEVFIHYFLKGYFENFPYKQEIVRDIPLFLRYRDVFLYQLFLDRWPHDTLEPWQKYTLEAMKKRIKNNEAIIDYDFTKIS